MIFATTFNMHIPFLAATSASELPWSQPMLQNNVVIVALIILFVAFNLLASHPKGVLSHQLTWLADTRNARTFEASAVVYPWIKPILYTQLYLFTGLSLFYSLDDSPAEHLLAPDIDTCIHLGFYLLVPVIFFIVQPFFFNWFCYLFRARFQQIIMNRTYHASLLLLSPFPVVIFMSSVVGSFSGNITLILLAALFILSQILFIFNGIKIFLRGFGSFLILIVYLCTLEIAPLWVLWIKLTT